MFDRRKKSVFQFDRKLNWLLIAIVMAVSPAWFGALQAGPICVPNASFESPVTLSESVTIDSWQKTPKPDSWDENSSGAWTNLTGIFQNTPPGNSDHIDNCDGNQAAWLFADPGVGLFQDYDSMDSNDPSPTHAFDVKFEAGKSYQLAVGVIGGGYSMLPDVPLEASLYYRDPASNKVIVAATTITYSTAVFSNRTHLIDFEVNVPTVKAGDAWAGQHIGIQMLSTVDTNLMGGYWDLDNVRLSSVLAPALLSPVRTNGQFQFTLQSEPGYAFEILTATNLSLSLSNWTSLGTVTNVTGAIPFIDTSTDFNQRFYQARQLP